MKTVSLLVLLLSTSTALATKLLLPLYVYPSFEGWWDNVYTAIGNNPDVEFQIIINPSNGPGGSTPGYNSDWISGVAQLNAFPNVHTFGYVYTSYNARAETDVDQDTADWALWNTYGGANISVNGIFFDEAPNWTGGQGAGDVAYMTSITRYAESQFAGQSAFQVIYNTGANPVHPEYFVLADYTVVFENYATAFNSDVLDKNVPSGQADKASILLHDFMASKLPDEAVQDWLDQIVAAGIGSANILDYGYDQANSADKPADVESVAGFLSSY